jgi:molybdate transport system substrate-binding protein
MEAGMSLGSLAAIMTIGMALFVANAGTAAEIRVSSIPFKGPLDQIGPQFERATGHKLTIKYAPSVPLRKQIDAGEPFDVVLIFPDVVDELMKQGKVIPGSRVDIARAPLGLAVRKGATKPDVRSPDGFKRALLTSASIAYAAQGPSGVHLTSLIERLGIAQDIKPKLRPMAAGSLVVGPVARGEVEIGIVSIPFILDEPGAELAGPLPRELQDYVHYSSGISRSTQDRSAQDRSTRDLDAAKAFISFFSRPASVDALKSNGLEVH